MAVNINELLKKDESKNLEFKERITDARKISKLAISFANSGGGTIVFGVKNRTREIVGVKNPLEAEEKIANIISDNCIPVIIPEIYITTINNKSLLVVNIPKGMLTPYHLKTKSKEESTFIRIGSTTKLADKDTIKYLELLRLNIKYDELPDNRFSINDLDKDLIKKLFNVKSVENSFLKRLKIINNDNIPVIGGLILFPGNERVLNKYDFVKIKCARFKGNRPVVFIDKAEFTGSIITQVENALSFIKRNIRLKVDIGELRRKEEYEYPISAIREAIVNAVVHRDYQKTGMDIRINIYDDRLEIVSPGILVETINIEDLFKVPISELRNKVIAYVFEKLNLIEAWGTGLIRIKDACERENINVEIQEYGYSFIMNFYKNVGKDVGNVGKDVGNVGKDVGNVGKDVGNIAKRIILLLKENNKFRYKELAEKLGVDEKTVERNLKKLKEKKIITRIGSRRNGYWQVNDTG